MSSIYEDYLLVPSASSSAWQQRWCTLQQDGRLRVHSHHTIATQTSPAEAETVYDLTVYESLQTSRSWGASPGPFELTLIAKAPSSVAPVASSASPVSSSASAAPSFPSPTPYLSPLHSHSPASTSSAFTSPTSISRSFSSMIPRVPTNASLSSFFDKSHPTATTATHRAAQPTISPVTAATPFSAISISLSGPEEQPTVPVKKGAWSRLSRRLQKSGSNSGSDRSLNDRFVRDGQRLASPYAPAQESCKLVLRALSESSMTQWAEAISQHIRKPRYESSSFSYSNPRRHQLAISVGPSILQTFASETRISEELEALRSQSQQVEEHSGIQINNLMHAAAADARRRRTESLLANPRRTSTTASAAESSSGGHVFAKRRLTRISSESSRRLSFIDIIDAARQSTSSGLSFRSNSISSRHNKADSSMSRNSGTESKRASLRSERRASSPMVLFNMFSSALASGGLAEVDAKASELEAVSEKPTEQIETVQEPEHPVETSATVQETESAATPALTLSNSFVNGLGLSFDETVPDSLSQPLETQQAHSAIEAAGSYDGSPAMLSISKGSSRSTSRSRFDSEYMSSQPSSLAPTPQTPQDSWVDDEPTVNTTPRGAATLLRQTPVGGDMPPPKFMSRLASSSSSDMLSTVAGESKGKSKGVFARRFAAARPAKLASRFRHVEPTARMSSYEISAPTIAPPMTVPINGLSSSFSAMQLNRNEGQITPEFERPPPLLRGDSSESNESPIFGSKVSPRLGTERILPPEMIISKLDEISRLEPSEAALARLGLMEHGLAPHEKAGSPRFLPAGLSGSASVADFEIERRGSPVARERPETSMSLASAASDMDACISASNGGRLEPRDFAPVFSRRNRVASSSSLAAIGSQQYRVDQFRSYTASTRPRSPLTESTFMPPSEASTDTAQSGDSVSSIPVFDATVSRDMSSRHSGLGGLPPPLRANRRRPALGLRAKSANVLGSRDMIAEGNESCGRKVSPRKVSPRKPTSPTKSQRLSRQYEAGGVATPIRSGTMGAGSALAARRRSLNRKSRLAQKRASRDLEADKENVFAVVAPSRSTSVVSIKSKSPVKASSPVKGGAAISSANIDEGEMEGEDEDDASMSLDDAQIYQVTARLRPVVVDVRASAVLRRGS